MWDNREQWMKKSELELEKGDKCRQIGGSGANWEGEGGWI